MAALIAGLVRRFQSFTKHNNLMRMRNVSSFSNSGRVSKGDKLPFAAFLLGCVGLVGFSGVYFRKVEARSEEEDNEQNNQCSRPIPRNKTPSRFQCSPWGLQTAIDESRSIVQCMKEESGCPGVCISVSVDGETVWSEGFGFADIENRVLCTTKTVMRIASISKPLTATAAAKLWEEGKLDLDAPIQTYVTSFPKKTFNGAAMTLTTRHLLSHLGGIRHYEKTPANNGNKDDKENMNSKNVTSKEHVMEQTAFSVVYTNDHQIYMAGESSKTVEKKLIEVTEMMENDSVTSSNERQSGFSCKEYFIMDHYKTVTDALSLFKDDPLVSAPGTSYLYTTHGWTLVSAVVERAANQEFLHVMKKLFKDLGMEHTCAEFNDKIIHNRARFYQRNKKGQLVNAPYVDNSYKWGGGGFLSTAEDLVQFGNCLLYAKQMGVTNKTSGCPPGFLQPETVTELWNIVANTEGQGHKDGGYGLGWAVIPEKQDFGACCHQSETVLHSGAAVGASSILLIRPTVGAQPLTGVVVAVLVNLQEVNLEKTAMAVAACFQKTQSL